MGKPYTNELSQLESTYNAAMDMNIERLLRAIAEYLTFPLMAVGSGGSLTAAHFIAALHQRFANQLAKGITPLELIGEGQIARKTTICLLSAGGRNSDIQAAFRSTILHEPQFLLVACARTDSLLSRLANKYQYVDVFDFDLPSPRDGFLATNSLLAFSLIFARAYHHLFNAHDELPESFQALIGCHESTEHFLHRLRDQCLDLWERKCFIVLYGPITQSAAVDLESKFSEAALGSVHLADYRNFAHGRHHWLAKRADISAVLALTTEQDRALAQRTLQFLPKDIPIKEFHFAGTKVTASLCAIITAFHIVGLAGEARGFDPGRPGVPKFGRRVYNLRVTDKLVVGTRRNMDRMTRSVLRKIEALPNMHDKNVQLDDWKRAYKEFNRKIGQISFSAVVFNYDGTLCESRNRFGDLSNEIVLELLRLLKGGVGIGIATGRGKSARVALRNAIPAKFWKRIVVGYYNGGECGLLAENKCPIATKRPCSELAPFADALLEDARLAQLSQITVRRTQISIELKPLIPFETLWSLVNEIIRKYSSAHARIVTSGHSIDVLAPRVSKRAVIDKVRTVLCNTSDALVLCIGDKGRWPGNDFDLLSEPYSLSVDEVSPDPKTCWNLAPAGYKRAQATLHYLQRMTIGNQGLKFRISR